MKNNHSFKFNSPDIPRNFPPQSNILFHPTSYHSISHRTIQPISQAPPPSNFRATRQVRESLIGARARNIFVLSSSHNSSNDRDRKIRKQKKKNDKDRGERREEEKWCQDVVRFRVVCKSARGKKRSGQ